MAGTTIRQFENRKEIGSDGSGLLDEMMRFGGDLARLYQICVIGRTMIGATLCASCVSESCI